MLNTRGGRVIFGVTPDRTVVGQQTGAQTVEDVSRELQAIDPPVFPSVDCVALADGREVIVVGVKRGQERPHTYKGVAYKRVGCTTIAMTRAEHNQMLSERLYSNQRWETEAAIDWSFEDLDAAEITRTLEEAIRRGRQDEPGTRDPVEVLRGFGLLRDGSLLNAAPVLFGRPAALESRMPQCLLRLARFRGVDKSEFVDNRQIHGNAFALLPLADRFLREHLPVAGRVVPNLFERADDPLYPPVALREAVANAVCHRDYSIGGGSVAVAIFDDRLEITSTGTLHFGITVEDLFRSHDSMPWNPLMAAVFYKRGIVERWGRGTLKMAELAQQAGLPRPEVEEAASCVTVRFRPDRYVPPERIQKKLTDDQRHLLSLIERHGRLALREMRTEQSWRAEWSIKEDLVALKALGLVDTFGHGRGAFWRRIS